MNDGPAVSSREPILDLFDKALERVPDASRSGARRRDRATMTAALALGVGAAYVDGARLRSSLNSPLASRANFQTQI